MNHSELLSLSRDFLSRSHNLKKEDIFPLREVIVEHNRLYHELEAPILSDTEYDALFHALARAESDYGMLDESSPTAKLAILASEQFQKVQHVYPMISLDNTYSMQEVEEWETRVKNILSPEDIPLWGLSYYVQPKFDGLGLALIYTDGKLTQAITRGNGTEGEDVTLNALQVDSIPKKLKQTINVYLKGRFEVRGEIMMTRDEFNKLNKAQAEKGEKLFANPRNAASGSLRQKSSLITASRKLQFFAYSIPQWEQDNPDIIPKGPYYKNLVVQLQNIGFDILPFGWYAIVSSNNGDSKMSELKEFLHKEASDSRTSFPFDTDGIVIRVDTMGLWTKIGRTEHHPRYAIAYKFPAKQVRTKVLSIEHSVGRTGTVTPVANLEAVDVGGVIVRRATLHNYDELAKKGVREGDYVFIMRAGEVIPEIVSVLTELRDGTEKIVEIPKTCPACQTHTRQDEGMVAVYCPNTHCPAKIQGQFEMFVGKQGLNIDGLGVKQIELFLELGWITDFASIFSLASYQDKLLELEGYKQKSVNNLLEAIKKSRHTTLDRVFVGLGIPNVGKKTAKSLSAIIYQLSEMKHLPIGETIQDITLEDLLEVKDIGPETAGAFIEYIQENIALIDKLLSELDLQIPANSASKIGEGILTGKSFCVTGSFDAVSRDTIHELIEKNRGEVRTAVTGKLDYLIVGSDAGSKKSKAEILGVKCIGIEEFRAML